jgi:hypothetical protein
VRHNQTDYSGPRCIRGHNLTADGAIVTTKGGRRRCRLCKIDGDRQRHAKRPALPPECPRCGTDLTDEANVIEWRKMRAHGLVVSRRCRPCSSKGGKTTSAKRIANKSTKPERHLSPAQTEAILNYRTARELAPPWVRHPQPLTHVVYRRAAQ